MPDYPHILERLINEPLLAHPDKAETVAAIVMSRGDVEVNVINTTVVNQPKANPLREQKMLSRRDGDVFLFDAQTGIAIIEITGSLAHKSGHIGASSGVMGYDGISAAFNAAIGSDAVRAIILDIHSAGGEVAGAFQLADRMFAARGIKPVMALVDEMAFSAAYLLAAAADEIWMASDTAHVGSVGVVMVHISLEGKLAAEGVKPTIIKAGAQKSDGNPFNDLPADVRARFQTRIDSVYDEFTVRIADWRDLSIEAVRGTEAATFMGMGAVDVGFADGISDPFLLFEALASDVNPQNAPFVAFA